MNTCEVIHQWREKAVLLFVPEKYGLLSMQLTAKKPTDLTRCDPHEYYQVQIIVLSYFYLCWFYVKHHFRPPLKMKGHWLKALTLRTASSLCMHECLFYMVSEATPSYELWFYKCLHSSKKAENHFTNWKWFSAAVAHLRILSSDICNCGEVKTIKAFQYVVQWSGLFISKIQGP